MPTPSDPMHATRLTADEIRQVVGDVQDATVAALIALGVSDPELRLAAKHATGNTDELGVPPPPLTGRAAEACDVLLGDPAFEPLERER